MYLYLQIFISIALIGVIILQAKGSGMTSSMLGSTNSYHTKRGLEKTLFIVTIVLSILFIVFAIASAI